jgi:hypothetical protein
MAFGRRDSARLLFQGESNPCPASAAWQFWIGRKKNQKRHCRSNKSATFLHRRCEIQVSLGKPKSHTRRTGRIVRAIPMKKLSILLVGFAFIGTVKATVIADTIIEGLPIKVISSGKSYKVFEQYPWEGHSSKYGPKENRLNPGHGVGVGKNIRHSLQVRYGDWIHIPDIGWRQINEFSSKKDGVEFFATHRNEYKGKHPRIEIDRVVFALPSQRPDHPPYRLAGSIPTNPRKLSSGL